MPISSADIAGANAQTALRRIATLEDRVTLLEKRLQTAGDIVGQMARTIEAMTLLMERQNREE